MNKIEFINKKNSFIEYLKNKRKSDNTINSYNVDLNNILNFWSLHEHNIKKNFNLEEIIIKYISMLYNTNAKKSSIARKISCINSFKKYLTNLNINLNVNIKRPKYTLEEPKFLGISELAKILDNTDLNNFPTQSPYRDKAIIELLYATGILCSEITEIEINNIDFKEKNILIRSKNKRERLVPFGQKALEYILLYIKYERESIKDNTEKLFLNNKNMPLGIRSIQKICKMFRNYLEENKILTPHILRNSFAIHMLKNGANIEEVQKLLGHKTLISTQRYLKKVHKN